MSRSGYSDDIEHWELIRWRGAVKSAMRGARGQTFLKEMLTALDGLPEKKLIAGEFEEGDAVCALGAVGRKRGLDMKGLDLEDRDRVAGTFGIAPAMAAEIVFENDEGAGYWSKETPEQRFIRVRRWVEAALLASKGAA